MRYLLFIGLMFFVYQGGQAQSVTELIAEGTSLLESGQAQDALAKLDAAIAQDGSNGEAYFKRGKIKSALQDDVGAIADYAKAVELGFSSGELYRLKGMSEHLTGDKDQSCADFQTAIDQGDPIAEDMKTRFCD